MRQRLTFATNITTATDTAIHSGPCVLERVVVNTDAAGSIIIYDNSAASGTKVATIEASPSLGTFEYGCLCSSGVTVTTGAALDITVLVTALGGTAAVVAAVPDTGDALLLESGDNLLLESGDLLLLG